MHKLNRQSFRTRLHGADKICNDLAKAQGKIGRSWGCPAVRGVIAHNLIDRISHGGLLFAYYPDPAFLKESKYVQCANNTAAAGEKTAP